ncbi:MAG: cytochrome c, partial [Steroidobacteraceae bacterium]
MTNTSTQTPRDALAKCLLLSVLLSTASLSQNKSFHHAPASARTDKNPYSGQNLSEGKAAFELNCAACHGPAGEGSGNIPSLSGGEAQGAGDGELFWYITKGDVNNGMPAWRSLSEEQRWEIVNYLRVLGASKPGSPRIPLSSEEAITMGINAPPPRAPFTDYRFEKPGTSRKITLEDLPAPLATTSAGNSPQVVARPEKAWPKVPAGFKVQLYAAGLDQPRLIRTAPNGDFFVAESKL